MYTERSVVNPPPSKDEAFVDGPLGFWRFPPQAQMLQRVMKMFVNLLCFFTGLKIWEVFSNLLYKLVQNLNRDLQKKVHNFMVERVLQKIKGNLIRMF